MYWAMMEKKYVFLSNIFQLFYITSISFEIAILATDQTIMQYSIYENNHTMKKHPSSRIRFNLKPNCTKVASDFIKSCSDLDKRENISKGFSVYICIYVYNQHS